MEWSRGRVGESITLHMVDCTRIRLCCGCAGAPSSAVREQRGNREKDDEQHPTNIYICIYV